MARDLTASGPNSGETLREGWQRYFCNIGQKVNHFHDHDLPEGSTNRGVPRQSNWLPTSEIIKHTFYTERRPHKKSQHILIHTVKRGRWARHFFEKMRTRSLDRIKCNRSSDWPLSRNRILLRGKSSTLMIDLKYDVIASH